MNQRPGLEPGNYISHGMDDAGRKAYRAEVRAITKDLHHARTLLMAVSRSDSITADDLIKAAPRAFSGRLTIKLGCIVGQQFVQMESTERQLEARVSYCTGQYFPVEYRKAVCAVLASALWEHVREHCTPTVGAYRVESWSQLGKGRTRHTEHASREPAEKQLQELGGSDYGSVCELYAQYGAYNRITWASAGDWLRAHFRKEFGRGIASRWFS